MNLTSNRKPCHIVSVGKARTGFQRYWCLEHKANATGYKGAPLETCSALESEYIPQSDTLFLKPSEYLGGISLWGASPPVYDTTCLKIDRGIHVHARHVLKGTKAIDRTYRAVTVQLQTDLLTDKPVQVSEIDAIYFMVSTLTQNEVKTVLCTYCGSEHLDKDWFAVNSHKRHLCSACGKHFFDDKRGIGNPIVSIQKYLGSTVEKRCIVPAGRTLNIRQSDYPGGIRVWAANPALLWISESPEEDGIHIHAYQDAGYVPTIDETFEKVTIDGIELDTLEVKLAMAQNCLPHLKDDLTFLSCPKCLKPHLDKDRKAITPHIEHECEFCGNTFQAKSRKKKTICNPMFQKVLMLGEHAPQKPRNDKLALRPEML